MAADESEKMIRLKIEWLTCDESGVFASELSHRVASYGNCFIISSTQSFFHVLNDFTLFRLKFFHCYALFLALDDVALSHIFSPSLSLCLIFLSFFPHRTSQVRLGGSINFMIFLLSALSHQSWLLWHSTSHRNVEVTSGLTSSTLVQFSFRSRVFFLLLVTKFSNSSPSALWHTHCTKTADSLALLKCATEWDWVRAKSYVNNSRCPSRRRTIWLIIF